MIGGWGIHAVILAMHHLTVRATHSRATLAQGRFFLLLHYFNDGYTGAIVTPLLLCLEYSIVTHVHCRSLVQHGKQNIGQCGIILWGMYCMYLNSSLLMLLCSNKARNKETKLPWCMMMMMHVWLVNRVRVAVHIYSLQWPCSPALHIYSIPDRTFANSAIHYIYYTVHIL